MNGWEMCDFFILLFSIFNKNTKYCSVFHFLPFLSTIRINNMYDDSMNRVQRLFYLDSNNLLHIIWLPAMNL